MRRTRLKKYSHEKLSASEKTSLAGSRATVGMQGMQQSGLLVRPDRFLEVLGSYEGGRDPARTRNWSRDGLCTPFLPVSSLSFFIGLQEIGEAAAFRRSLVDYML